jgi:large conductance mechanosensitive channel
MEIWTYFVFPTFDYRCEGLIFVFTFHSKTNYYGFIKEFKEFALRGNVMDLAIGVIIGAAFNNIVKALVDAVIMPIIGILTGDVHKFQSLEIGGIKIGVLIQAILDFIVIAFALFLIVKAMTSSRKKEEASANPLPTTTEILLTEIRDELKKR